MQVVTRDIAEQLEIEGRNGIRVVQVFDDTPAERAGLKVGDVIIAINGQPVDASEPSDIEMLPVMIRKYAIGSEVSITIIRSKKELDLLVTLGSSPRSPREMKKYRDENFEFTVRDIAFMDRVNERWTDKQKGVVVENVSSGSWAGLANVLVGDLEPDWE
jgi:serine protease Do